MEAKQLGAGAKAVLVGAALVAAAIASAQTRDAKAQDVKRGQYLANFGGCNDCHTPKVMSPQGPVPDRSRLLSGFPADAPVPPVPAGALGPAQWGALTNGELTAWAGPWGISFAANLTPDKATGLGAWSYAQFRDTMRRGKHLGTGRELLPPMPWMSVAGLDDADLRALFAYLKSLKPIENRVPAPIPPK
jgi:mono/diheme cytochrome c family protein